MSGLGWRPSSRRAFLASAAAVIALPFLPSLAPRQAARASATAPLRLVWWFVPNGMHMPSWNPTSLGTSYTLPPLLEPVAHHRGQLRLLRGVDAYGGEIPAHLIGTAGFLTGALATMDGLRLARSVDQVAAALLGGQTRFASMQLGTEGPRIPANCDPGYSCQYYAHLSWADEVTPLPPLVDAQVVFDRMFGGLDVGATAEERARRAALRTSVLDHAVDDVASLEGQLGVEDRARLDRFLTGVRELEQDIAFEAAGGVCDASGIGDLDTSDPTSLTDRMSDLMALAMACDLSRVITFAAANGGSLRSYSFLGVEGSHHQLSHHGGDAATQAKLEIIDRWEMERFAYALDRFADTEDVDGTSLLDNLFLMFGAELADGNDHTLQDLPVLIGGGAGGRLVPGQAMALDHRPLADVHLTGLHLAGLSPRLWSHATGPISELIV